MDHPTGTWNRNRSSYLQKQLWGALSWHIADIQLQSIQVHSVMPRDEKQEEKGLAMTGRWPLILKQPWLKGGCRSSFQGRPREDTWNTNNSTLRKTNAHPECVTWVEKGGGFPSIPIPLVLNIQHNIPQTAPNKNLHNLQLYLGF